MKTLEEWLNAYGESHQHQTNVIIHKVAVPAIVMSVFGILWSLPVPQQIPGLNWAVVVSIAAVFFYGYLSVTLALGMLMWMVMQYALFSWLEPQLPIPLWQLMLAVFIVSWALQFIGHALEGKRPSFTNDIIFLLIGPLWVLVPLYKKVGIKYTLKNTTRRK